MALSEGEIATVKGMLLRGDKQHDIAAYFGVLPRSAPVKPVAASQRH
jgi:hypothetical protein